MAFAILLDWVDWSGICTLLLLIMLFAPFMGVVVRAIAPIRGPNFAAFTVAALVRCPLVALRICSPTNPVILRVFDAGNVIGRRTLGRLYNAAIKLRGRQTSALSRACTSPYN